VVVVDTVAILWCCESRVVVTSLELRIPTLDNVLVSEIAQNVIL
jgi:hypothetical protein